MPPAVDDGSTLQTVLTLLLDVHAGKRVGGVRAVGDGSARACLCPRPGRGAPGAGACSTWRRIGPECRRRAASARLLLAAFALSALAWGAHGLVPHTWGTWLYVSAVALELQGAAAGRVRFRAAGRRIRAGPAGCGWDCSPSSCSARPCWASWIGAVHLAGSAPARLAVTMSFALPVGIWWFYFRLLDRAGAAPARGRRPVADATCTKPMTFAVDGDGRGGGGEPVRVHRRATGRRRRSACWRAARHLMAGGAGRGAGPDLPERAG